MEKIVFAVVLSVFFMLFIAAYLAAGVLPPERCIDWTTAGIPGGFKDYPVSVNVMDFGAKADGKTDDSKALMDAIADAKNNTAVFIPAGTYLIKNPITFGKSIVLRGAGKDKTFLVFDFAGNPAKDAINISADNSGEWVEIISGYEKGSEKILVDSGGEFTEGGFAELCQDNDPEAMYTSSNWNQPWAQNVCGQLFKVEKVNGNEIFMDEPLHLDYKKALNVRVRPVSMVIGAGVEALALKRIDKGDANMITVKYGAYCRIKDIESEYILRTHAALESSYKCEVIGSTFHHAHDYGGGGHGYGVELKHRTNNCLVEGNTFYTLRHSMMVHLGANGNVFGYNISTDPVATGDHTPGTMICDVSIHGHYPYMNLFEGNTVQKIEVSDYWGPSGPGNTFFRNIIKTEVIVNEQSPYQNFLYNAVENEGRELLIREDSVINTIVDTGNSFGAGKNPIKTAVKSLYKKAK